MQQRVASALLFLQRTEQLAQEFQAHAERYDLDSEEEAWEVETAAGVEEEEGACEEEPSQSRDSSAAPKALRETAEEITPAPPTPPLHIAPQGEARYGTRPASRLQRAYGCGEGGMASPETLVRIKLAAQRSLQREEEKRAAAEAARAAAADRERAAEREKKRAAAEKAPCQASAHNGAVLSRGGREGCDSRASRTRAPGLARAGSGSLEEVLPIQDSAQCLSAKPVVAPGRPAKAAAPRPGSAEAVQLERELEGLKRMSRHAMTPEQVARYLDIKTSLNELQQQRTARKPRQGWNGSSSLRPSSAPSPASSVPSTPIASRLRPRGEQGGNPLSRIPKPSPRGTPSQASSVAGSVRGGQGTPREETPRGGRAGGGAQLRREGPARACPRPDFVLPSLSSELPPFDLLGQQEQERPSTASSTDSRSKKGEEEKEEGTSPCSVLPDCSLFSSGPSSPADGQLEQQSVGESTPQCPTPRLNSWQGDVRLSTPGISPAVPSKPPLSLPPGQASTRLPKLPPSPRPSSAPPQPQATPSRPAVKGTRVAALKSAFQGLAPGSSPPSGRSQSPFSRQGPVMPLEQSGLVCFTADHEVELPPKGRSPSQPKERHHPKQQGPAQDSGPQCVSHPIPISPSP